MGISEVKTTVNPKQGSPFKPQPAFRTPTCEPRPDPGSAVNSAHGDNRLSGNERSSSPGVRSNPSGPR